MNGTARFLQGDPIHSKPLPTYQAIVLKPVYQGRFFSPNLSVKKHRNIWLNVWSNFSRNQSLRLKLRYEKNMLASIWLNINWKPKREKTRKTNKFVQEFPSKDGLGMESAWNPLSIVQLIQEGVPTSFTVFDACRSFAAHAQSLTPTISSRIEYLMPIYGTPLKL